MRYVVTTRRTYECSFLVYADDAEEAQEVVEMGDGWEDTSHIQFLDEEVTDVRLDGKREEEVDA